MTDREKVIGGLEQMLIHYNEMIKLDGDTKNHVLLYHKAMVEDAIELLKDQDPVEPELEGGGSTWWHVCGECHGAIDVSDNFCKHCGRRIKHEKLTAGKDRHSCGRSLSKAPISKIGRSWFAPSRPRH